MPELNICPDFSYSLQMLFRRNWCMALVAAVIMSGCAGQSDSSPDNNSALATSIAQKCSAVNAPDLGDGSVCFDNGFRVKSDDFSFANWGRSVSADANVTVQTLIDLFGHSAVCLPGSETSCILRPTTIQVLEQWNNALSGGRCEGIATLSNRLFLKYDRPTDFVNGAQSVSDLTKTSPALAKSIVYWWATQFLPEVRDRAAESRALTPLELVDQLIEGLANNVGYTLGMYFGATGHSVTPFAVTHRGNDFVIHVYDNNEPGERREVVIDGKNNTWRFPKAYTALDGTSIDWDGAKGTLELVPMSARQGPFTCMFCNSAPSSSQRVLTIASRDPQSPGYVAIRTRNGKTLTSRPDGIENSIPGAQYDIGKGAQNSLVAISIPDDAGDFDVFIRRANESATAGDVVVNLQRNDAADIQVTGNLAVEDIASRTFNVPLLAVRNNDTTVHAPKGSIARLSIAAGTNLSHTNLDPGSSLVIRNIRSNAIEVSLKGAANKEVAAALFPATSGTAAFTSQWTLNEDQQLVAATEKLTAVSVTASPTIAFTPRKAPQTTTSIEVPSSIIISRPD